MSSKLKEFTIYELWGKKEVCLKFKDNRLIMVGENGSGKTTILRMLYETLACKWELLSLEDFKKIKIVFEDNKAVTVWKKYILRTNELLINQDSPILRDLPNAVTWYLKEHPSQTSSNITYKKILEVLDDLGYSDLSIYSNLKEKLETIETDKIIRYTNDIRSKIDSKIIYLPTYRRVEKNLSDYNPKSEALYRHRRGPFYGNNIDDVRAESMEIAKTGMGDVENFILYTLNNVRNKANITASRLNYQCFKGILNRISDEVKYDKNLLSDEELEKVFGSLNEDVLTDDESDQIKLQLKNMQSKAPTATHDKIVYYFYSMLHKRYEELKIEEKIILDFFDSCNVYLENKKFVYNEKEYTYKIIMDGEDEARQINISNLSSGEKQVVSMFSYLYLSTIDKTIILIDEPEISMSVDWQTRFLLDISKGKQCDGLITVTHSPFVFDNELRKYAYSLEEFIK